MTHLEPELIFFEHIEQLRGIFEQFSRMHARNRREGPPPKQHRERRRKNHAHAHDIGLYRLEELVV